MGDLQTDVLMVVSTVGEDRAHESELLFARQTDNQMDNQMAKKRQYFAKYDIWAIRRGVTTCEKRKRATIVS